MTFIRVGFLAIFICGCASDSDEASSNDSSNTNGQQASSSMDMSGGAASNDQTEVSENKLFSIGYREDTVSYTPTVRSDERTIPLHIWYPTNDTTGPSSMYQTVFERDSIFMDASSALKSKAPLLVFSHGRRGFGQYSFFMAEYFAERGFVVAAMDHVGDTLGDNVTPDDIFSVRPQDISATIDYMLNRPPTDPLNGRISDDIVLAGHSFGGYT